MKSSKKPEPTETQIERFKRTAKELECDESESEFEKKLQRVAGHKPAGTRGKGA